MEEVELDLTEQEAIRRAKLDKYKEKGIDPFGKAYERTANSIELKTKYENHTKEDLLELNEHVSVAGRIMTKRGKGKAGFMHIQDKYGQLQIYVRSDHLTEDEFEKLDFEVTVLTKPEIIEVAHYEQYFDEIEIGRDGLIIQKGYARGLLLPQVAPENGFSVEEFLDHTCMKAGISADSWMDESCDVYKFQGQIFK